MRLLRNLLIVAVLAVPVAFLPGGGQVARAIVTALVLAFLATLGLAGLQLYRQNKLTVTSLPDGERAVLLGAVGVIVLMIAGTSQLLNTAGGTLVWIVLILLAGFAIVRVWTESRSY